MDEIKILKEKIKAAMEEAVKDLGADDYNWNEWEKGEYKRIYLSIITYKGSYSRHKEKKCGYIDLIKNEYIAFNRYSRCYDVLKKEYV